MPCFEERSLFVGDTQIRWYEPGVREGRIDVHPQTNRGLVPLEARRDGIVHGDGLVRQHGWDHTLFIMESLSPGVTHYGDRFCAR